MFLMPLQVSNNLTVGNDYLRSLDRPIKPYDVAVMTCPAFTRFMSNAAI